MERISRQQVREVVGGRCTEEGRRRRGGGLVNVLGLELCRIFVGFRGVVHENLRSILQRIATHSTRKDENCYFVAGFISSVYNPVFVFCGLR